ncbi:hypothetical protein POM88_029381 [Heracleum sosnowskyi]|uniref:Vitellogenin n=1 Tax=Heracleum sosnowskyi TaxID=360622 RepID=A0AAD8MIF1_9APIA|nr:hypothetical protein POM88_029381 [Heracleum sosnowskyi]
MLLKFYTAIILTSMVFSEKGYEFTEPAIPSLVKLIPSPFLFVQIQALYALSHIAKVFPACCNHKLWGIGTLGAETRIACAEKPEFTYVVHSNYVLNVLNTASDTTEEMVGAIKTKSSHQERY